MMEQESSLQLVGQFSCRMSAQLLVGRVSALRFHAPLLRSVRATMKAIHRGAVKAKAGCWRAKAAAAATTTWHQAHCCSCTAQALLMYCVRKEVIACQQDMLYAGCSRSTRFYCDVILIAGPQLRQLTYGLH